MVSKKRELTIPSENTILRKTWSWKYLISWGRNPYKKNANWQSPLKTQPSETRGLGNASSDGLKTQNGISMVWRFPFFFWHHLCRNCVYKLTSLIINPWSSLLIFHALQMQLMRGPWGAGLLGLITIDVLKHQRLSHIIPPLYYTHPLLYPLIFRDFGNFYVGF